ncbi:MAG: hypothetical protein RIT43_2215 [Bacteroidota bacterium]|jgi:uracil-DNA glycosylase
MDLKLEDGWNKVLNEEFEKEYFIHLIDFVKNEYTTKPGSIFPEDRFILRALNSCPFENVRVVILGQDPYPTKGHAHGLCFSVEEAVRPIPKSLQNIFKELSTDIGTPEAKSGSLVHWAEQGVLLLNSVLTVEEGKPESHAGKGWERFTDAVIQKLSSQKQGLVYMLWGMKAQQKAQFVNPECNLVLKSVHPSPLSAHRGFFGCRHFSQANAYLSDMGVSPVNW